MTEGEYNKKLLERVRKAEAEERRRKEADEAEAQILGGCLAGIFMLFIGLFKLILLSLRQWGNFTQRRQKAGVIIILSILFVISFIGGFLSSIDGSIGGWWIFLFGIVVFFVLPIYMVKALGWLKGIIFTLLSWFMFVEVIIGVDYIISKNITPQNTLKLSAKNGFVNLRQSPNGNVIAQINTKDLDKIILKKLDDNNTKWVKVLYFPPNIKSENKAIVGYIHISQIDNNLSQNKEAK